MCSGLFEKFLWLPQDDFLLLLLVILLGITWKQICYLAHLYFQISKGGFSTFEYALGLCHKTFEIFIELFESSFLLGLLLLRMKVLRLKIMIAVVPWRVLMISPSHIVGVGLGIVLTNNTNMIFSTPLTCFHWLISLWGPCWPKGLPP